MQLEITDFLNKTQGRIAGLDSSASLDGDAKQKGFTLSPIKIGKPNFQDTQYNLKTGHSPGMKSTIYPGTKPNINQIMLSTFE